MSGILFRAGKFDTKSFAAFLSWDPQSCTTNGLFLYPSGFQGQVLDLIRESSKRTRHPMAIIFGVLEIITSTYTSNLYAANNLVDQLHSDMCLMGQESQLPYNRKTASSWPASNYAAANNSLLEAYQLVKRDLHPFLSDSRAIIASISDIIPLPTDEELKKSLEADLQDFSIRLEVLRIFLKNYKGASKKASERVDVTLRVVRRSEQSINAISFRANVTKLCSMMQQEDSKTNCSIALSSKKPAEASMRDSPSMKAIAVLTMVFLPSTAVAVSVMKSSSGLILKTLLNKM